jgi:HEAT repeat protein
MGFTKPAHDFLVNVLTNEKEHYVTRHEAAEALGNFYFDDDIPLMEQFLKHENEEIRFSALLALNKIKNKKICKERCG